jgi:hypothetical protein
MPGRVRQAYTRLSAVTGEVQRVLGGLTNATSGLAGRPVVVVAGVLGGSTAMLLTYVVCTYAPSLSFILLGPLATVVGISASILAARRIRLTVFEGEAEQQQRLIAQNREVARLLHEAAGRLPPGTPKAIRDEHYRLIMDVNRKLAELARPASLPPDIPRLPPPQAQDE